MLVKDIPSQSSVIFPGSCFPR